MRKHDHSTFQLKLRHTIVFLFIEKREEEQTVADHYLMKENEPVPELDRNKREILVIVWQYEVQDQHEMALVDETSYYVAWQNQNDFKAISQHKRKC